MARPRRGFAPSLPNDPRDRQSTDTGSNNQDISPPLSLDAQGRVSIAVAGPVHITSDGKLNVEASHGLTIQTGSPKRIVARTSDTIVVGIDGNLHARIRPPNVEGLDAHVKAVIRATAVDISFAEVLMSETAPGDDAVPLYNSNGTDWVYSEVLY